ncbi:MAG: sulfatase-like hydrolase/transferase [Gemmatales bacterium]
MKVILLTLHGARLDAFGAYGGALAATPHLDRLAAESTVFDQHYVSELHATSDEDEISNPMLDVLDELTAHLTTSGGSCAFFADERVSQSLSYSASWKHVSLVTDNDLAMLEQPTLCDAVLQQSIDWLQDYGQHYQNWLLSIELGSLLPDWREEEFKPGEATAGEEPREPLFEYDPSTTTPDPNRFGWRAAYGGVMHYVDELIGQFTTLLNELQLTDQCLLIVQSQGGQPLGEYGPIPHREHGIFEERAHVPLIMRFPRGAGAGKRVHHYTHPEDVLLTIYQMITGEAPNDLQADHLVRYTQGQAGRYRDYAVTLQHASDGQIDYATLRSKNWSITVPWHHEADQPLQLYRKPEDRWEMNNVAKEHTEVAEHLELTLRRYVAWKEQGCLGNAPELREEVLQVLAQ